MDIIYDYKMPIAASLYRYDLVIPPNEWDANHKNPEYVNDTHGCKNQLGAFFFFTSLYQAEGTARCAIHKNKEAGYFNVWLTKCQTIGETKLLDFRDFHSFIALIIKLRWKGINILTEEFSTYGYGEKLFSSIANDIDFIEGLSKTGTDWVMDRALCYKVEEAVKRIEMLLEIPKENIGVFCQQLTDFQNGKKFKELLYDQGYEGYIFNESNHTLGSDTICLFSSNKLSKPNVIKEIQ